MEIRIRTGFQTIQHNICFQPETMNKGKKLVAAQHVRDVEEVRQNKHGFLIKGRIIRQASVNATPYNTSLHINEERVVTDVTCDCVYHNSGKCKHVAALIHFINSEESLSKTSEEQQWGKPSPRQFVQQKYCKGKYFKEMYPTTKTRKRCTCKVTAINLTDLTEDSPLKFITEAAATDEIKYAVKTVLASLLKQVDINVEKADCASLVNNFIKLSEKYPLYNTTFDLEKHLKTFYETNIMIGKTEIINLCCNTLHQSKSEEWFAARQLRFSASKHIHSIKTRTRKTVDSLVLDILNPTQFETAATKYGLDNEGNAKKAYERLNKCQVKRAGVMISPNQSWLCASIDGAVFTNNCMTKLVEFKCPITCKRKPVIDLANNKSNVAYLKCVNGEVVLNPSNIYYTQVQVQMYVCGMNICDLFVYSPVVNGSYVVQIHRNEDFLRNVIMKSERFYFNNFLPALYSRIKEANNQNQNSLNNNNSSIKQPNISAQKPSFTGRDIINIL